MLVYLWAATGILLSFNLSQDRSWVMFFISNSISWAAHNEEPLGRCRSRPRFGISVVLLRYSPTASWYSKNREVLTNGSFISCEEVDNEKDAATLKMSGSPSKPSCVSRGPVSGCGLVLLLWRVRGEAPELSQWVSDSGVLCQVGVTMSCRANCEIQFFLIRHHYVDPIVN